jgi:hypothetical protein
MIMDGGISKGQLVIYTFGQDTLAASQTDVALNRVIAEASETVDNSVAPFPFDIIGLAATLSAAATTSTLAISPTINGTKKTALTQTITTQTEKYGVVPREKISGVAGDNIGVKITTGGTWDGTTSDLVVDVFVLYYLDGI